MVQGILSSQGTIVQRCRVRRLLNEVNPEAAAQRWSQTIQRRQYSVPCSNSLWHVDGHMKLAR